MTSLQVLFEDNHLLVVNKPAGIATMGTSPDEPSMVTVAADYIKRRYHKPGNVYIGVVSRLDRLVTGVLVLARTSKAAARLSEQIRNRTTSKRYLAWVEGVLDTGSNPTAWQTVTHWMSKNEAAERMQVAAPHSSGAQQAELRLRTKATQSNRTLVEIELVTGRKHQIRVQLAELGHCILGDKKYGAQTSFRNGIALHCEHLIIEHPTLRTTLTFQAPLPNYWPEARG